MSFSNTPADWEDVGPRIMVDVTLVPPPSSSRTPEQQAAANVETIVAQTIGKLIGLAVSAVKHYHSDFVRDAFWLHRLLMAQPTPRGRAVYWSADSCGTAIGTSLDDVAWSRGLENLHRLTFMKVEAWGRTEIHVQIARYTNLVAST